MSYTEDEIREFELAKDTLNALVGAYSARLAAATDEAEVERLEEAQAAVAATQRTMRIGQVAEVIEKAEAELAAVRAGS